MELFTSTNRRLLANFTVMHQTPTRTNPCSSRKSRKVASLGCVHPCIDVPFSRQSPSQRAGESCGARSACTVATGLCSVFISGPSHPQYCVVTGSSSFISGPHVPRVPFFDQLGASSWIEYEYISVSTSAHGTSRLQSRPLSEKDNAIKHCLARVRICQHRSSAGDCSL